MYKVRLWWHLVDGEVKRVQLSSALRKHSRTVKLVNKSW